MDNKQTPNRADEKTKIMSSSTPTGNPVPGNIGIKPQSFPGGQVVNPNLGKQNQAAPIKNPTQSYFKNGNTKAKRTILAGAISGGLLVGLLGLTSFMPKPKENQKSGEGVKPQEEKPSDTITEGEVVTINTGHEIYTGINDDLTLEEAQLVAREEVGVDGLLMYKNELHLARSTEEWDALTEDEKLAVLNDINVMAPKEGDLVTIPVDVNGEIKDLVMDPLYKTDEFQMAKDPNSGQSYIIPQGGEAIALQNITSKGNGEYLRIDPETGAESLFTFEEVFTQLDETGRVQVDISLADEEEPLYSETYSYLVTENGLEVKTDEQRIQEYIIQKAHESGIEDISKLKIENNGDGSFSYKVKGDGEKIKGTVSIEDVLTAESEEPLIGEVILEQENQEEIFEGEVLLNDTEFALNINEEIPDANAFNTLADDAQISDTLDQTPIS